MRAKRLKPLPLPVCSAHRDRAGLCSPLRHTLSAVVMDDELAATQLFTTKTASLFLLSLQGCLGNANVFLISWSILPCEFLLGFIALGLQTISSQLALALPSCLINGTVWRREILVLGWLKIFNQKLRLKRIPHPPFQEMGTFIQLLGVCKLWERGGPAW